MEWKWGHLSALCLYCFPGPGVQQRNNTGWGCQYKYVNFKNPIRQLQVQHDNKQKLIEI